MTIRMSLFGVIIFHFIKMRCLTWLCKPPSGSRGSLKSVVMITISESDNWEINSSSGMKYGQFVDWEKIDPDAASKYQEILKSSHHQLKAMGRAGFWTMPHTLRAKAYYHIIHGINSRFGVILKHLLECLKTILLRDKWYLMYFSNNIWTLCKVQ